MKTKYIALVTALIGITPTTVTATTTTIHCPNLSLQISTFDPTHSGQFQIFNHHDTITSEINIDNELRTLSIHYQGLLDQTQSTDHVGQNSIYTQWTQANNQILAENPLPPIIICQCEDGYVVHASEPNCVSDKNVHTTVDVSLGSDSILKFDVTTNTSQQALINGIIGKVFPTQYSPYESPVRIPTNSSIIFPDLIAGSETHTAAMYLYGLGIIGGRSDGFFGGSINTNRAEISKFLLNASNTSVDETLSNTFVDVLDKEWYTRFIIEAEDEGILTASANQELFPTKEVNVAEFLKMFTISFNEPLNQAYTYTDVNLSDWFEPYVGVAQTHDLFEHDNGGFLSPSKVLTRSEIALALYRYLSE